MKILKIYSKKNEIFTQDCSQDGFLSYLLNRYV